MSVNFANYMVKLNNLNTNSKPDLELNAIKF